MSPRRVLGILWFLSWFELYLEIFRHRHVTAGLLLHPLAWFVATTAGPHPGDWLRTVLVCSAATPLLFGLVVAWRRLHRGGDSDPSTNSLERSFPIALAAMVFGSTLCALATVNQLIRHDPLAIDLTLRHGNGGFIVLGAALIAAGLLLRDLRLLRSILSAGVH